MIFLSISACVILLMYRLSDCLADFVVYCREEELSSCQDQLEEFRCAASALSKWLEETNNKVPAAQPSDSEKNLEKDMQTVTVSHGINKQHIM